MQRTWVTWLAVFAGMLVAGEGLGLLLRLQGWPAAGETLAWVGRIAAAGWLLRGLWLWREVRWVQRVTALTLGTAGALLAYLFCLTVGWENLAVAVLGVYAMGLGFFGGLWLIRLGLGLGHPVFGVARTLIDEAIRMKVALIFIVALLLLVPVLPMVMDPEELLKYRLQTFLTWSMMAVGGLLGLMTVFLAVATITREVSERQIFLTMTKPVGRGQYILGKWLGIALLNLLLVGVCGGGIYTFTQYLAQQPAQGEEDRRSVQQEVLTARVSTHPVPGSEGELARRTEQRLVELQREAPERFGEPGTALTQLPVGTQRFVQQQVLAQWHSLGPRETKTYVFEGLDPPGGSEQMVQFRIKPETAVPSPDGYVYLNAQVNGRRMQVPRLANENFHVLQIPAAAIEEGQLRIELTNAVLPGDRTQPTITFNVEDGIRLLYAAGTFEANLIRGMAMMWVRLCFLGMLGLAAGTFLGFPTASMVSLLIYVAAAMSGYLNESLAHYGPSPDASLPVFEQILWVPAEIVRSLGDGDVGRMLQVVVGMIGSAFVSLVPPFGEYNPTGNLAEGVLVELSWVGRAMLWMGLVWTGVTGVGAWLIFRKRELAQVTV